jgi:hypothetical protein
MSYQDAARASRKPSKVRQACDSCHSRKVRCDGCRPCANCREATAACTYLAVHKKTGPKGGPRRPRPPVHPQRSAPWSSDWSSPDPTRNCHSPQSTPQANAPTAPQAEAPSDGAFQPSHQLSADVIRWCLDAFFEHKHPITPILHREQVEQCLDSLPISPESYGLFAACCSVISLSPEILPPPPSYSIYYGLTLPSTEFLISETLRSRRHCNLAEHQSLTHTQTSFFLFSAFFCMGKDNAAWFYLRESITMLQTLRLHEETTYIELGDPILATYSRRMFWVLYITERAYALQRHRPLTLQNTLDLPGVNAMTPDAEILPGFLDLISLFRHFDIGFIETWNSATLPHSAASNSEPLSRLQDVLKYALPSVSNYSKMQQADLLISRQWLKVMVWKLCVSKTFLSSAGSEDSMSLHYPVTIARDAVLVSRLLPARALEANGVGILEKMFDIGCSLADLLSLTPTAGHPSTMEIGPVDTLMEIVRILDTTLGGSYRHLSVLTDKASQCLLLSIERGLPAIVEDSPQEFGSMGQADS